MAYDPSGGDHVPGDAHISGGVVLRHRAEIEQRVQLSDSEREFFDREAESERLPFAVTHHYLSLVEDVPGDPIRRQFMPTASELVSKSYELSDPLGEERYMPVARLVHRYRDRALLLTTDTCAVHCRHCFRRRFAGSGRGALREADLDAAIDYLDSHAEIRELLLSGGDPLTLSDERLSDTLRRLRSRRSDLVLRIATRIPVVLPRRIGSATVDMIRNARPVWVVVQVNHPRELSPQCEASLSSLVEAGVPVVTQTVLLRGVNDSVDILERLFSRLVALMVKPYYLFQGDLVPGTAHFRVQIERALDLVRELRARVSGLAMPTYAVDCPDGGGKVPLTEQYLVGKSDGWYVLRAPDGREYRYPVEDES